MTQTTQPVATPTLNAAPTPPVSVFNGWRLTLVLIATVAVASGAVAFTVGGVDGANEGIRITARTSAVLFLLAFTASANYRLWPGAGTAWVRRNRRYLGVAFAGSHVVHAAFIVASVELNKNLFTARASHAPHAVYALDTIAYLFIIAMTVTSFDGVVRRMKFVVWQRIHLIGSYVIWFTFFIAYWRRGVTYPLFYGPLLLVVLAALVIRLVGKAQRQRGDSTTQ